MHFAHYFSVVEARLLGKRKHAASVAHVDFFALLCIHLLALRPRGHRVVFTRFAIAVHFLVGQFYFACVGRQFGHAAAVNLL